VLARLNDTTIEETDAIGDAIHTFVIGDGMDQQVAFVDAAGQLVHTLDDVGGSVMLAWQNAATWERYLYSGSGMLSVFNALGIEQPAASPLSPHLFKGRPRIGNLPLYNFRRRLYSAEDGRFLSRVPLGYTDGANPYEAFRGEPVLGQDPTGTPSHAHRAVGRRVHQQEAGEPYRRRPSQQDRRRPGVAGIRNRPRDSQEFQSNTQRCSNRTEAAQPVACRTHQGRKLAG
jgi:RHS repeat-associated protein